MNKVVAFLFLYLFSNSLLYSQQQVIQISSSPAMSDFTFSGNSYVTDSYNPRKMTFQNGYSITSGQYYKQYFNQSLYSINPNFDSIVVKVKYKTSPGYGKSISVEAVSWMSSMYFNTMPLVTDIDSGYIHINYSNLPVTVPFDVKFIVGKQDTTLNNFYVFFYESDIKGYITGQGIGLNENSSATVNWWYFNNIIYSNSELLNEKIEIYNILGKTIYSNNIEGEQTKISLEPGIYIVQIGEARRKILVE